MPQVADVSIPPKGVAPSSLVSLRIVENAEVTLRRRRERWLRWMADSSQTISEERKRRLSHAAFMGREMLVKISNRIYKIKQYRGRMPLGQMRGMDKKSFRMAEEIGLTVPQQVTPPTAEE